MEHHIAFIARDSPFSGKLTSTKNLIEGLNHAGASTTINESVEAAGRAVFHAVTCLEDADLLGSVPPDQRIIWLRRNPTQLGPINIPEGGGRWIATSLNQAKLRKASLGEVFVLPEAIKLPPRGDVEDIEPSTRKGLLFVGRVCRNKQFPILLNALRLLPPDETLTVAGPYEGVMIRLAEGLGVGGRVRFLGYLENAELRPYYLAAKFLLAPCRSEPFGMPVVEALGHGCTPIAVAGSGGPDEVLGGTPYLIQPDPQDFARAVLNCVQMPIEKSLALAQFASHHVVAQNLLDFLDG